jgi:hypothetical protein
VSTVLPNNPSPQPLGTSLWFRLVLYSPLSVLARSTSFRTNSCGFSYYLYLPLDLDPIGFYHRSRFRPTRALTSRSAYPANRSTCIRALCSLSSRPIPLLLVSVNWLVHVSLKGHLFSSRSLIFSIVNQQVGLAGTPHYRPGSHVCHAQG